MVNRHGFLDSPTEFEAKHSTVPKSFLESALYLREAVEIADAGADSDILVFISIIPFLGLFR